MGSGLCTPKNKIVVEYDASNQVKNFTIHGCYYYAPLEFQFKRPPQLSSTTPVTTQSSTTPPTESCCVQQEKSPPKKNTTERKTKVVPF